MTGPKMRSEDSASNSNALRHFLDLPALQSLSESFYRLTGISLAVLDLKGEILIASGWMSIYTQFHRKNPITASRCLESGTVLAGRLKVGERYSAYRCKKIRDDKGYWEQIETYIQNHSQAKFSHGLCHDCANKLYPDYFHKPDAV